MSHALYTTRLYWEGSSGVAKLHGVMVFLHCPPTVCGRQVEYIDYTPEVRCVDVRFRGEARREMRDDEIRAMDGLLYALTQGAAV